LIEVHGYDYGNNNPLNNVILINPVADQKAKENATLAFSSSSAGAIGLGATCGMAGLLLGLSLNYLSKKYYFKKPH